MYFCLAPKSTSPDVVALRLKSAPTSHLPPETGVTPTRISTPPPTTGAPMTRAVPTQAMQTQAMPIQAAPTQAAPTRLTPTTMVMLTETPVPTKGVMLTRMSVPTEGVTQTERAVPTEGPSGAGPDGSGVAPLGDLTVTNVTQTSLALTWLALEAMFNSFRVELAPSTPMALTQVKVVPGSARSAHFDGLLPGTQYEVSVYGMVEGEQTQPIVVVANTTKGTWTSAVCF